MQSSERINVKENVACPDAAQQCIAVKIWEGMEGKGYTREKHGTKEKWPSTSWGGAKK